MNNQKGMTLVEILAVLAILMIISYIIFSVFFGINKNFAKISGKTDLQRETNLIISTIRSYHLKNTAYKLSFNSTDKKAFIGETTANNRLNRDDLELLAFTITYKETTYTNSDVTIDQTNKPIEITITL
ncbi:type II secretion system protein [Neobacillus citreus]|uniref:Prepilin-type N-terminal cleavage/methylation domain-containing protein n=1 Tax=Neobacillus citreus TaxID=2833578 RepID=A0A942T200_9BACI|nr:prepilin-type N-terminal cleavage/methylation domain-containing protein [Neobacillus citreus]MCH6266685.1 type II secretion system GspH family protein [Neobacillus citreus]